MKKQVLLLLIVVSITISAKAQLYYSLTSSISSFTPISGGTVPYFNENGTDPLSDEGYATDIPIGFNFTFNKNFTYSTVSISTNGFISFGSLTQSYPENSLLDGAPGERPIVAPLWDDLNVGILSNLTYKTIGTSPNKTFIVQWLNTRWGLGASSAAISFQVQLHEANNEIEFIYSQEAGSPINPSASVGIAGNSIGVNNFASLTSFTSPAISSTVENKTLSTKPSTNQSFLFKPLGVTPVTLSSISVVKEKETHVVSWQTLNETNAAGFHLQRSTNGIDFSTIATQRSKAINGNSNSTLSYQIIDTKPLEGTSYYRIKQIDNDGKIAYSKIISIRKAVTNWASISVYPNPIVDKLNLKIYSNENTTVSITIINANGQKVIQQKQAISIYDNNVTIAANQLTTGIYTVKIVNEKTNEAIIKQFVK